MITLQDLATQAGVSVGTVSRVLNGKNKENRPAIAKRSERIRRIADQLGYRPNAAARSMLTGRFRAVAFVTCGDAGTDWYPISGVNSIHSTLDAFGWRLLYNELPASKINNPALVPQLFRETAVDGLVINLLPAFSEELADYFEAQPLPCVWMNLKRKLRSVYPDEVSGIARGVHWLVQRGHQRIGYFSRLFSERSPHYSAADRFHGFMSAMQEVSLPSTRHWNPTAQNESPAAPVFERAVTFLKTFPDVQAVLCYELEEAICLLTAAERAGRRVPDDLEIIGCHEREIRASSGLRIPTLVIPFREVGRLAVEMLVHIIETNNDDVPSVVVPYTAIAS